MNNLKNEISKTITKVLTEGDIVEKAIEKTLTNKVSDIIDDVFSYNSEPRKLMKKKLNESFMGFINNYDFNENLVNLEEVFNQIIKELGADRNNKIVEKFKTYSCYKPPTKINITELFDMYKVFIKEKIDIDYDDFNGEESKEIEVSFEFDGMSDYNSNRSWSSITYYAIRFRNEFDEELNRDIILYTWDNMKEKNEKDVELFIDGGFKTDIKMSELKNMEEIEVKLMLMKNNMTKIILDKDSESDYVEIEREW